MRTYLARLIPLALSLAALCCSCGSRQPDKLFGSAVPQIRASSAAAQLEREMFERINLDRSRNGLATLQYDERLADIARAHAFDMKTHLFFAHESPNTGSLEDRLDRAGYLAREARENLAAAPSVQTAQDNLLESPGHRVNLLAPHVTHVGVGIVQGGPEGDPRNLTITQVFASPVRHGSPAEARTEIGTKLAAARRAKGLAPLVLNHSLDDILAQQIEQLPDDLPSSALEQISSAVRDGISEGQGRSLAGIVVSAQLLFSAEGFTVPPNALEPATVQYGLSTTGASDPRGRPRIKVLLVLGYERQR
jgi:uncharacterized protein YkwD